MKYDIRHTQLLNTALAQIQRDGWAATTHRSIAEELRINLQTVYQHFAKRCDLRDACVATVPGLVLPVEPDQRMSPKDRTRMMLEHALKLAAVHGYKNITARQISDAAGVGPTLYARYFGNLNQMRVAIMRAAVKQEVLPVIAQGIAVKDPHAMKAPPELRTRAIESLTTT